MWLLTTLIAIVDLLPLLAAYLAAHFVARFAAQLAHFAARLIGSIFEFHSITLLFANEVFDATIVCCHKLVMNFFHDVARHFEISPLLAFTVL